MYKKYIRNDGLHAARFVGKILLSKLVERKKLIRSDLFPRIGFPGLIYCDQEPFWLLNVIEGDCYFLGCIYTAINSM